MSLSNANIKETLAKSFVCVWRNTEGNKSAGGSFAHKPSDPAPSCIRGNGEHNIQMLFLTPNGELFHVLAGYLSPQDLRAELDFAVKAYGELAKANEGDRKQLITKAHERFLTASNQKQRTGFFAEAERFRAQQDHGFAAKHPLLAYEKFQPEMLVGSGTSFFGSTSNSMPSGFIGDQKGREMLQKALGGGPKDK